METSNDHNLIEGIKEAFQNNDQALTVAKIQQKLDLEKNIPLAVTGESGSGKSTFINAFRGIQDRDEGAARTGTEETTKEVTAYPHPNYPNVTLWDLPGIGTTNFPANKYLKLVKFERFDFFIIISDTRFRENDVMLAKKIQKMGKKLYFVRSKIDNDLNARKQSEKSKFNEGKTLSQIREDCIQGLQKAGVVSPQVFLMSIFDLQLYDFPLLGETLERELPEHRMDDLLVMPNISPEVINKKKKAFHDKIKYVAILSTCGAAVPVPGLSIAVDVGLLTGVITHYVLGFGLDIPSLKRLSNRTNVPFNDLMALIISPLVGTEITPHLVLKVIGQFAGTAALMTAEEGSRFIPILGIPLAMGFSYISNYIILQTILDVLAEDAQRVLNKVLQSNTLG